MKRYLGIDIGGTSIKYGVFNEYGEEVRSQSGVMSTNRDDLESMLSILTSIIKSLEPLDGVGVSVPGGVDGESGLVIEGGACTCLDQVNLKDLLKERSGYTISMENDANCVALAEKWVGNGKDCRNFVCVTLGTGVGGGIFLNNQLYRGSHFLAGEFGLMIQNENDGLQNENIVSFHYATLPLVAKVKQALDIESDDFDGKDVFRLIHEENEEVTAIYQKWIHGIVCLIQNIGFAFDPEKILIGGGVSVVPMVLEDIRSGVEKIHPLTSNWDIDICKCYNDSGKLGAAYLCMTEQH